MIGMIGMLYIYSGDDKFAGFENIKVKGLDVHIDKLIAFEDIRDLSACGDSFREFVKKINGEI